MNNASKLDPIAKINRQHEQNAGRRHGETLRNMQQQQKQLEELINYRDYYTKAFLSASEAGISVVQMQEYKLFISRLDEAIALQTNQVTNVQNHCEISQKDWMQKRNKRRMIEKAIENRQHAEQKALDRREQKEQDDLPR
ncbi:MAG TPA: flagellar export protein FliJ [Gammaproteobacteria bacterium]|nr:flagellar export protein FliJ [Gammaproteobacteria bacterium]